MLKWWPKEINHNTNQTTNHQKPGPKSEPEMYWNLLDRYWIVIPRQLSHRREVLSGVCGAIFLHFVEFLKIGWNSEIGSKFWNGVEILKFGQKFEICWRWWGGLTTFKLSWKVVSHYIKVVSHHIKVVSRHLQLLQLTTFKCKLTTYL